MSMKISCPTVPHVWGVVVMAHPEGAHTPLAELLYGGQVGTVLSLRK